MPIHRQEIQRLKNLNIISNDPPLTSVLKFSIFDRKCRAHSHLGILPVPHKLSYYTSILLLLNDLISDFAVVYGMKYQRLNGH